MALGDEELLIIIRAQNEASKTLKDVKESVGEVEKQISGFQKSMNKFSKHVVDGLTIGLAIKAVDMGIRAVEESFGKGIQTAVEFETEMWELNQVTGLTKNSMVSFGGQVNTLSSQLQGLADSGGVFTKNQVATAFTKLSREGYEASEAMEALASAQDLAIAGQIDLNTAVDVTAKTLKAFNLGVSQSQRVADMFVQASYLSSESVSELASSMQSMGPIARSLNLDLEETLALATTLSDEMDLTQATAGIKVAMTSFASLKGEAKELADSLNLKLTGKEDIIEVVKKFQKALKDSGKEGDSARIAIELFGSKGAAAVLALLGNIDKLNENLVKIEDSAGIADKAVGEWANTTEAKIKRLGNSWTDFWGNVGGGAIDIADILSGTLGERQFKQIMLDTKALDQFGLSFEQLDAEIKKAGLSYDLLMAAASRGGEEGQRLINEFIAHLKEVGEESKKAAEEQKKNAEAGAAFWNRVLGPMQEAIEMNNTLKTQETELLTIDKNIREGLEGINLQSDFWSGSLSDVDAQLEFIKGQVDVIFQKYENGLISLEQARNLTAQWRQEYDALASSKDLAEFEEEFNKELAKRKTLAGLNNEKFNEELETSKLLVEWRERLEDAILNDTTATEAEIAKYRELQEALKEAAQAGSTLYDVLNGTSSSGSYTSSGGTYTSSGGNPYSGGSSMWDEAARERERVEREATLRHPQQERQMATGGYVSANGLYYLHKGESVKTVTETTKTNTFSPVFHIHGGDARENARQVQEVMRREYQRYTRRAL